ncbi:MAG: hypothetical protein ACJAY8_000573 [Sphingobacteriales bacterium]
MGCKSFDNQQKKYLAHFHGRGTNLKPNHLQTTVDGIAKLMNFVRIGGKSQKLPAQFLAFFFLHYFKHLKNQTQKKEHRVLI